MSHSFSVSNISNLPVQATISNLGISNLRFTDDSPQPQNNTWPNDESYLYIDDVSVRPVETSFSDGTFTARVFANSSPEDYELAIKLVTEIASSNNTSIQPEGDVDMDVESFLRNYDKNWIAEHCNTMFQMLAGTITHHQSTATLSGTRRELANRVFRIVLHDHWRSANADGRTLRWHDRESSLRLWEQWEAWKPS